MELRGSKRAYWSLAGPIGAKLGLAGLIDWPTNWRQRKTNSQTGWQMEGKMSGGTGRQTDRQTERPMIKMNSANWFLDPENIVQDTKIIILSALVQKLWCKTCFCKMAESIMYPYLVNMQTAKDLVIDQDLSTCKKLRSFLLLVSKIMTNFMLFKDERLSTVRYRMKWMAPSDSLTQKTWS